MSDQTTSSFLSPIAADAALDDRARKSLGTSSDAIYEMVAHALAAHDIRGETLVDVGCGSGNLWRKACSRFSHYVGLDAVRYDAFPDAAEFRHIDLDTDVWPIDPCSADAAAAVETIEHLANPWAFVRRLAGVVKPGGWVLVTTPNQLSLLSLLSLVFRQRFVAFPDAHFPTHRTALLESDLRRAAQESGLRPIAVGYSHRGRVPLTPWHYPTTVARVFPRALSDNVMLVARKPHV